MSQVDLSDGWTAAGTVSTVQSTLNTFLSGLGMRVVGEQEGEVHARKGRWPAAILGGRLTPARWLPALAIVRFQSVSGGVAVRVNIEDAWTAGQLSPRLTDKYRKHFADWMGGLKAALR